MEEFETKKRTDRKELYVISFLVPGLTMVLITILVVLVYLTDKGYLKKNKETEYEVKEETITKYNNLLNYLNVETKDVEPEKSITRISALTIGNNIINVFGENNDYSIQYEIELSNIDVFSEEKVLGTYATNVTLMENTTDELKLSGTKSVGRVYTIVNGNGTKYISYTTQYNDGSIASNVGAEYNTTGVYQAEAKIKPDDNQALYDFYYYLLNK